jgi:C4-dicarboxylate transporter DctM subunit
MPRDDPVPLQRVGRPAFAALLPLSMPIVLLGGIYSGVFTPTEAAAVAALHALILATVFFRALTWRASGAWCWSRPAAVPSSPDPGGLLHAELRLHRRRRAAGHGAMGRQHAAGAIAFLLLVNLMFLVLGCFLDVSVLLLVFVPMLLPAAKLLGIDLVHFGVLVVLNMMIGLITRRSACCCSSPRRSPASRSAR